MKHIVSTFKKRAADVLNGDVTDIESDANLDVVSKASTPFDDTIKTLINKKCASIELQATRIMTKHVAKKNFLGHQIS